MAHLTRPIPIEHGGGRDGWQADDQVGFDPTKVYRSPIDLQSAATVTPHSHRFSWNLQGVGGFPDTFLSSRVWSLNERIRVFAETVVQGNVHIKGYEAPGEYSGGIPYQRDLDFGKSAKYFHNSIRLTGGFGQVREILRNSKIVALIIRSMIMQAMVDLVLGHPFFVFTLDEGSIGNEQEQRVAFVQSVLSNTGPALSFRTTCKGVALEVLEIIKPLLDIAAEHWPKRGPALSLVVQALFNQVSEAGLISVALRTRPGHISFSMAVPGEPYHFRRYIQRPLRSVGIESLPLKLKKASTKTLGDNVFVAVFVPLQPFVQRAPEDSYTLDGIIAHGDVVTYETTTRTMAPQDPVSRSIIFRPHAYTWSLFTPMVLRKTVVNLANLMIFFFFFGLAFKIFWSENLIFFTKRCWLSLFTHAMSVFHVVRTRVNLV
ncbi:hypothetical protein BROUX41_005020 [Berkeleyomyces rouxiae]|uniref:uncharacterized protein n=1 Tax=Berkeleyomyces rouxiae TaxID=2035830 RepID=UPI003B824891